MQPLTAAQLKAIAPAAVNADVYAGYLQAAMCRYNIDTPERAAAFLANVMHESGQLRYMREIWGPTVAQRGYEGRKDLGNTHAGDGSRYRGRGLFQITGRANYAAAGHDLELDLIAHPELLEQPQYAALSAGWFWDKKGLNDLADKGQFVTIVRKINGGWNGLAERQLYYDRAKRALK